MDKADSMRQEAAKQFAFPVDIMTLEEIRLAYGGFQPAQADGWQHLDKWAGMWRAKRA